jgi:hypothetical protein
MALTFIIGSGYGVAYSQQDLRAQSDMERQKTIDAREQERRSQMVKAHELNNDPLRITPQERRISQSRGRYKTLPRKLTKENLKYLEPALADYKKYESFLIQPDTGLIKLLPDIGCRKIMVIDASSPCVINASIPGDGAAYSFRTKTYLEKELSDLMLKDGKFQTEGVLIQGILFKLGNTPIETVSLESKGMRFLTNFVYAKNSKDAAAQKARLEKGIKVDEFTYSANQTLAENTTYGLRSIAYRGVGWIDKRVDVVAVFCVVRINDDGSAVIVWKQLQSKESPIMKK